MAWTATLLSVTKVDGNAVARIRFVDGAEVIEQDVPSGSWTPATLRAYVQARVDGLAARDAAAAAIAGLVGQSVTPTPNPEPQDLLDFRRDVRRLRFLLSLSSTTPATVTKIGQIRTAVEAALVANPTWIDDARI